MSSIRIKKGVIFDLDGTLVDTMTPIFLLVKNNLKKYGKSIEHKKNIIGKELMQEFHMKSTEIKKSTIPSLFWNVGIKYGLNRLQCFFFTSKILLQVNSVYSLAKTFPYVRTGLIDLTSNNLTLGLFTMASQKQAMTILNNNQITNFFKAIVTRNDITKTKPHPQGLFKTIRMMGIQPNSDNVIFVGDLPADIIAGKNAGVHTIAITTGLVNEEQFQEFCEPDIIVSSFEEAVNYILSYWNLG